MAVKLTNSYAQVLKSLPDHQKSAWAMKDSNSKALKGKDPEVVDALHDLIDRINKGTAVSQESLNNIQYWQQQYIPHSTTILNKSDESEQGSEIVDPAELEGVFDHLLQDSDQRSSSYRDIDGFLDDLIDQLEEDPDTVENSLSTDKDREQNLELDEDLEPEQDLELHKQIAEDTEPIDHSDEQSEKAGEINANPKPEQSYFLRPQLARFQQELHAHLQKQQELQRDFQLLNDGVELAQSPESLLSKAERLNQSFQKFNKRFGQFLEKNPKLAKDHPKKFSNAQNGLTKAAQNDIVVQDCIKALKNKFGKKPQPAQGPENEPQAEPEFNPKPRP